MFNIILDPGHGINTAGKRCDKKLDPNETREWVLNSRICNYIEQMLADYKGYKLYRVDDRTGKTDVPLATRVKNANTIYDKDCLNYYISVHHNAAANLTKAGGIIAYSCTNSSATSVELRDDLYKALIKHTGLKGNRSDPTTTANYYVIKNTKMPAVLLELGYMDSLIDTPIILTEDYAKKCATAITEVLINRGKLKKKVVKPTSTTTISNPTKYRVQVGAYKIKANATNMQKNLKALGYSTLIVTEKDANGKSVYKVQVGSFKIKNNAINLQKDLKSKGYNSIIKAI